MELQLLGALLSICLFCMALGSRVEDEDEDEALLHSHNAPLHELNCVPDASCIVPDTGLSAFRHQGPQKQLELKLKFQPQQELLRSTVGDTERLLRYDSNTLICPAESFKDVRYEKQKLTQTTARYEDYEDDENKADAAEDDDSEDNDDDDDDDDDDGKVFAARISCLLRSLYENTLSLNDDLKELHAGLFPPKSSEPGKEVNNATSTSSKPSASANQPSNLTYVPAKHYDYFYTSNTDPNANDEDEPKANQLSKLNEVPCEPEDKEETEAQAKEIIEQQPSSGGILPFNYLPMSMPVPVAMPVPMPFVMQSDRMTVPPLIQLLSRRSTIPWSIQAPIKKEGHRYLHALNEMRLARAVQAATAARFRQQKSNIEVQEQVAEFNENLRRIIYNRADIERRVTGLLAGITRDAMPFIPYI